MLILRLTKRSISCSQTRDWLTDHQYTDFGQISKSSMASIHLDIITSSSWRQQGDNLKQFNRALWLLVEHSISLKIPLPDSSAMCRTRECIRLNSSFKFERENCKTFWIHNYYNNTYNDKIKKINKVVICPKLKIYSRIYNISNISMTNVGT